MYRKESGQPVLRLKNDLLFKAVYGSDTEESKYILISLLNKILRRTEDPIIGIEYKNPFNLRHYISEKENILDIKAETNNNELIDIEMQIMWGKDMPSRLLSYHGGLLREALQAGEKYDKMKQTITICITDSIAFSETDKFLTEFYLMEEEEHFLFTRITRICCIELPKVNREGKSPEEMTPLEICLEYLKNADENGSEYVDELIRRGGKDLKMAQNILRKATEEEILRERAITHEKFLMDQAYWRDSYARGIREGKEEGFKEGRAEAAKEIAKKLKEAGIPIEVIAENTGLKIREVESL